jgi:hypothetical protein
MFSVFHWGFFYDTTTTLCAVCGVWYSTGSFYRLAVELVGLLKQWRRDFSEHFKNIQLSASLGLYQWQLS